jgi:kinesin family protein 4/21/27
MANIQGIILFFMKQWMQDVFLFLFWCKSLFLITYFLSCFPFVRLLSMSPDAKVARIASLENMLGMSSAALKAMTSQLTEAEERERALNNRGRWNQLRSMGEAKNVLQNLFNATAEARCSLSSNNFISFSSFYLYN